MVAHVAFAALLLEDLSGNVIDQLKLPYAPVAWPRIQLHQSVGVGQRLLIGVTSPPDQPAPEVFEPVIRAAAVDYVRRSPEIPGVRLVEISPKRRLERYNFLKRSSRSAMRKASVWALGS